MRVCTKEGTYLRRLIRMAIPLCQAAEVRCPRRGPGAKPVISDWVMAVLITVAVLKQRRSKSSQYRFLQAYQGELMKLLKISRWPARSTFFDRYRRAWRLYEVAIQIGGEQAIEKRLVNPHCLAVDKSTIPACGPLWSPRAKTLGRTPRGADLEASWTYSRHHGWVLGYGFEVVVNAENSGAVWPLVASVSPAGWQPPKTFPEKIPCLPHPTRYVLADSGYDSNHLADLVESSHPRRLVRRLLCPYAEHRSGTSRSPKETRKRKAARLRRRERHAFMKTTFAKRLLHRRGAKIEPFFDWLKSRFDLHHHAWHRGLNNNRTQILAAIFAYQLLLLFNYEHGNRNGCIQWILDIL